MSKHVLFRPIFVGQIDGLVEEGDGSSKYGRVRRNAPNLAHKCLY